MIKNPMKKNPDHDKWGLNNVIIAVIFTWWYFLTFVPTVVKQVVVDFVQLCHGMLKLRIRALLSDCTCITDYIRVTEIGTACKQTTNGNLKA